MKIAVLIISCAVLIFAIQNAFAQTEKQIAAIRAEVAAINKNIAKYKRTKKDVEGISLEGTEATFYSSAGNLKKATAKIYGETYNATAEIYYKDDKPIFIYQKFNKYDTTFSQSPKIIRVEETRTYYVDGEIVRILVGKKEVKSADEKFSEVKMNFEDLSEKLFAAFKQ